MNPDNRVALEHERMTQRATDAPLGEDPGEAESSASSLDMVCADERTCEWQPWCRTAGECIKAVEERRRAYLAKRRAAAKQNTDEDRADYRRRHPECTTESNTAVDALIELEQMGGRAK